MMDAYSNSSVPMGRLFNFVAAAGIVATLSGCMSTHSVENSPYSPPDRDALFERWEHERLLHQDSIDGEIISSYLDQFVGIVAIRAAAELGDPEKDAIYAERLVHLIDIGIPGVTDAINKKRVELDLVESRLRQHVARKFIRDQVRAIGLKGRDRPHLPAAVALLDLWRQDERPEDQRRFQKISTAFIREEIALSLKDSGYAIEELEEIMRSSFGGAPVCKTIEGKDGAVGARCSGEAPMFM